MDYFVPDFGRSVDDVINPEQSLAAAEKQLGHTWVWKPEEEEIVQYAHPPLDSDIVDTQNHLSAAETDLGHTWDIENVQLDSDPICSSAGCTQYAHKKTPLGYPIDYPVPYHGPDPDML